VTALHDCARGDGYITLYWHDAAERNALVATVKRKMIAILLTAAANPTLCDAQGGTPMDTAKDEKSRARLKGDFPAKVLFLGQGHRVRVTIPAGAPVRDARKIIGALGRPVKAMISRRGQMQDGERFNIDGDGTALYLADFEGWQEITGDGLASDVCSVAREGKLATLQGFAGRPSYINCKG
jgi:hypothetical protein